HIRYAHEHGIKHYDQFGTVGDLRKDNPLLGLHEFKKKFGGEYIEFIGEFTYVTNAPLYFVFTKLVPFYRRIVRLLLRRRKKDEV
ncbi:MAG: peptidoglycan bridge formation glycyltransferase FemA/FemB family protein, partial [Firmicutes bacterium]|nr:peptidoglycan bridge formation glycyltransferase FemA/FemB family protein [Bacillota bacterium]